MERNLKISRAEFVHNLLVGKHGSRYTPPTPQFQRFSDVPPSHWAYAWVEEAYQEGITTGCGGGNFCPESKVTRAQVAIFLLRGEHGGSYSPPTPGAQRFSDVASNHWAYAWIEQAYQEGFMDGCGAGKFCPEDLLAGEEAQLFIQRVFSGSSSTRVYLYSSERPHAVTSVGSNKYSYD